MPYETYPFLNGGAQGLAPQQQAGPMGAAMPQQMPPQAQDPHSQYLAQALAAMGKQPGPTTPMAMSADLLAQALDRYGLAQGQRRQSTPGAYGFNPTMLGPDGSFTG